MKLSNAFEFVCTDMPCFSVFFSYSGESQRETVYWNHFWKPEISRCLEKVRQLDDGQSMHKAWFHISGTRLSACASDQLLATLEGAIDGQHYATEKRQISSEAGFDESNFSGQITWKEGVTIEDIIDAQIGLKDTLEVSNITVQSNRFNTPRPIIQATTGGSVQMRSHPKACLLQFSSERANREVLVRAQAFAPSLPGLPWDMTRIRAVSEFVQVVFSGGTSKLEFNFETKEEEQGPNSLLEMLQLYFIFSAGDVGIRFLTAEAREMLGGEGQLEAKPLHKRHLELERFVQTLGLVGADTKLSIGDLLDRTGQILRHNYFVGSPQLVLNLVPEWGTADCAKPVKAFYYSAVEFPSFTVCTIGRRSGRYDETEGEGKFRFGEAEYAHSRCYPGHFEEVRESLDKELERRGQKHVAYVVLGDLNTLAAS